MVNSVSRTLTADVLYNCTTNIPNSIFQPQSEHPGRSLVGSQHLQKLLKARILVERPD
jgi:hypothetical protein